MSVNGLPGMRRSLTYFDIELTQTELVKSSSTGAKESEGLSADINI